MQTPPKDPELDHAAAILRLLGDRTRLAILAMIAVEEMSVTAIAESLGRSKSEIFRMLQVLEARGYLARGENDSSYVLTNRLFLLGMERPPIKDLARAALPVMHRLADETGGVAAQHREG